MAFTKPTFVAAGDSGNDWDYDAWPKVNLLFDAANAGALQGFKNRLINGGFRLNQRAAASNADDTYCLDRWYVLTQTGTIAASQLTDPETGAVNGIRLTQSQAVAQRMGLAQIIESANCRDLRSVITTLAGRLRLSTSDNIRYAVLEWTGTADAVTSDVVSNWTSTSYTAGGFFNSTTLNVLAVGQVAAVAATWRDLTALNATLGASANNIIVMVWTENAVAQNVTLDLNSMQFEAGATATHFDHLPISVVTALCQRYFQLGGGGASGRSASTVSVVVGAPFPAVMRAAPTRAVVNTGYSVRVNGTSSSAATGAAIVNSGATVDGWYIQTNGFTGLTVADTVHVISANPFSFDAEL